MSRTRDLVGLVAGSVRAPVKELTIEERINLFHVFNSLLSKYYHFSRGGYLFRDWASKTINSLGTMEETPGFKLQHTKKPREKSYDTSTRIFVLGHITFNLRTNQLFTERQWETGGEFAFCRLCLTQDGNSWFEYYEATVGKNRFADVYSAEYTQMSSRNGQSIGRLATLFEAHPSLLNRYCHSALELVNEESVQREARAKQGRDLFNELARVGKPFDISIAT
jgi:hypothetical protein